tara:strand:+ start:1085 stop:1756 length:672 start_codon:yes stop_codon:yes gene_type:complete
MPIDGILADLDFQGWSQFSSQDCSIDKVMGQLGFIIMENDVLIERNSPALVTSAEGLPPHTDHHLSHYILWHCLVPDSQGGYSIMVDGLRIFRSMPSNIQELLRSIHLKEHSVFKGDVGYHPLIYETPIGDRIYYSVLFEPTAFWLAGEILTKEQKEAFDTFNEAVRVAKTMRIKLKPGECLVVDNRRILHGRSPLQYNSNRLLKRYWIGKEELEKSVEQRVG